MKRTGIILELDDNGGITIPLEVLEEVGIEYNDSVEMYTRGDNLHLAKEE